MTQFAAPRPTARRTAVPAPAERVHAVLLAAEIRASGPAALLAHALPVAAGSLARA